MPLPNKNLTLILLGIIGTVFFILINWWTLFSGSTSEQAVESPINISKLQAQHTAEEFVNHLCSSCSVESFVTFQSNTKLSGYIQKNKLIESFNASAEAEVPLDYFQVDIVDAAAKVHFIIDIHPFSGKVIGWQTWSKQTKPSGSPSNGLQAAESSATRMGYNLDQFTIKEVDKQIILQHKSQKVGEAPLQLRIKTVNGEVIAFHPAYSIPKAYQKWLSTQDSASSLMGLISLIVSFLMMVAAILFAVRYRHTVSFSTGVILSIIFTAAYGINNINLYPGFKSTAGLADDNAIYGIGMVLLMQFFILIMALSVYFSFAAGAEMWKKRGWDFYPRWKQSSFGRDLMQGMGQGYLLCLFLLGIQSFLFLLAEKYFDVWSTNDPSSSPYNMLWPSLFPLLAWAAAISEEAVYRVFGIALFKKLLGNSFLSVLIPSMIWALGHTQYPIYPVYTRFVEVTILGLIFGYAFLKFGFITVMFAHASMDSILMAFSLISLGGAADVLTGLCYIAFPALLAIFLSRLHARLNLSSLIKLN